MDGINKRIDDEKIEREKGLNNLSDRLSTEIRDREEVNEAVTDALQVNKWYIYNAGKIGNNQYSSDFSMNGLMINFRSCQSS